MTLFCREPLVTPWVLWSQYNWTRILKQNKHWRQRIKNPCHGMPMMSRTRYYFHKLAQTPLRQKEESLRRTTDKKANAKMTSISPVTMSPIMSRKNRVWLAYPTQSLSILTRFYFRLLKLLFKSRPSRLSLPKQELRLPSSNYNGYLVESLSRGWT